MNRTIEQWSGCQPEAMATEQSDVARTFAFADAKADILESHRENERLRDLLADLKGENAVLAGLLRDCDAVLATIEADDGDEAQKLGDLRMALAYAIDPYKREGTLL